MIATIQGGVIPLGQLKGACAPQMALVRSLWPDGIPITAASVETAIERRLNMEWIAQHLLAAQARAEYRRAKAPALAEYERVVDQAWAEYQRVTAPAGAEYERVVDQAWAEYQRVTAPAGAEYERIKAQARAEYERITGMALVRLILSFEK